MRSTDEFCPTAVRATKADEFGRCELDRIREMAGGYEGESPDAAAQRRQEALEVVMANRAEEHFGANRINADQYAEIMGQIAPEVITEPEAEPEAESASDWNMEKYIADGKPQDQTTPDTEGN
jgi:hypothetical protein